ncbi:Uncharacterised protein [Budvicia aquatica]|uniref:Uncharacterized protein n=1 Tax=Budvicia aquatica TaxID=82979 RepID=A0A484ZQL6_9GAMM|nr:hypothetical protein [Budvicia aquatica]VFS51017.1 Uncharacterised protein [Budvicia aquatica]
MKSRSHFIHNFFCCSDTIYTTGSDGYRNSTVLHIAIKHSFFDAANFPIAESIQDPLGCDNPNITRWGSDFDKILRTDLKNRLFSFFTGG